MSDTDECGWYYFARSYSPNACTDDGTLQALNLGDNGLSGVLPPEIGLLTTLIDLSVPTNRIASTIPTTIGLLTALSELFLFGNRFTGTVPTTIGLLTELRQLDLDFMPTLAGK